jgi:hypothetical protein
VFHRNPTRERGLSQTDPSLTHRFTIGRLEIRASAPSELEIGVTGSGASVLLTVSNAAGDLAGMLNLLHPEKWPRPRLLQSSLLVYLFTL